MGTMDKAQEYVNMVRQRAANPAGLLKGKLIGYEPDEEDPSQLDFNKPILDTAQYAANYVINTYDEPFVSQEMALAAIRFERKLELALEGHRFYDLLRYGVVAEAVNDYIDYEEDFLPNQLGGAVFTPEQDEYLPIPQDQIDLQGSDILTQNPGY